METDWVLDKHEKLTGKQILTLYILLDSSGLELCPRLSYQRDAGFEGAAMNTKYGNFVTYIMKGSEHYFTHCKRISYRKLIKMLEQEIKSKSDG